MANINLTNQRQVFVEEYVRSGDHLEAAKKAGYKDTHTLRNQAFKLRRECANEITDELQRNFAEIAPRTLNILFELDENAESEFTFKGVINKNIRYYLDNSFKSSILTSHIIYHILFHNLFDSEKGGVMKKIFPNL